MALDIFLLVLACLLIGAGIAGSFLPVLPGPPLAFAGLLAAHYTPYVSFSTPVLIIYAVLVIVLTVIDYLLPVWTTRWSGGTPNGARGALIGTLVGMFIPIPFGIFIGAFAGAYLGERSAGKTDREAMIAGFASFLGFVAGSVLKALFCITMGLHLLINWIF